MEVGESSEEANNVEEEEEDIVSNASENENENGFECDNCGRTFVYIVRYILSLWINACVFIYLSCFHCIVA